jgi:ABC-type uncharacterized transport system substrate-binding protein
MKGQLGLVVLVVLSCQGNGRAESIGLIMNSNDAKYSVAAGTVEGSLKGHTFKRYSLARLDRKGARSLASKIAKANHKVLVALGDKAVFVVKKYLPGTPMVFGLAHNWQALNVDRKKATGVDTNMEPETMVSQIKMFFPERKRVGVIYTKKSRHYVERAMTKAALLKMTILPIFMSEGAEFNDLFENLAKQVSIYWLVQDPALITADNMHTVMEESVRRKMVTVCSSAKLVKAGLTMSITMDPGRVGRQLAGVVKKILDGTSPGGIKVASPDQAQISLNKEHIKQFKIKIDPMLLDFVVLVKPIKKPGK